MRITVVALLVAASLAVPATAHADDDVPTPDQVTGIMNELTDPNIPAANKGDIVSPPFDDHQARAVDAILNYCRTWGMLPVPFIVTNIQPAPNHMAGATVSNPRVWHLRAGGGPVVLVNQGGRWMLTSDSAVNAVKQVERNQANGHAI
jgi:hypothetical protein